MRTSVLALTLLGCTASHWTPSGYPQTVPSVASEQLLVGIARTDITPPVGLGLAGHGPEGRVAEGTRLRLQCTAFVLHQQREVVALVPCELGWVSDALVREILSRVRRNGIPLEDRQLLLAASHTHAGPAHFFLESNYRGAFSSRGAGFDPHFLAWLADRIAGAITEAFRRREPARVGWGSGDVEGLAFNQSVEGFLANQSLPERLRTRLRHDPRELRSAGGALAQRALDPTMSLLRIDRNDGTPMGAFVVYGMHPTAVPNSNELYHGDVFGFAFRAAEQQLSARGQRVLIGMANGIEGDIVAAVHGPSVSEARRVGNELGRHITRLMEQTRTQSSRNQLRAKSVRLDLVRHMSIGIDGSMERLCCTPALGSPSGGGANDGPTRFRIVPALTEGQRDPRWMGCHGPKLLLQLGDPFVPGRDFPSRAPLHLFQVGNGYVGSAPAELSTVTGERFRSAIQRGLSGSANGSAPIAIVGLANGYLQYVATPEEYELQRYEGASTLYGPRTEPFLSSYFGCLARSFAGMGECVAVERDYPTCSVPPEEPIVDEFVERFRGSIERVGSLQQRSLEVDISEGERGMLLEFSGFWPEHGIPAETQFIQVEGRGGVVAREDSASIEVRYYEHGRWSVRWIPEFAPGAPGCGQQYRFVLRNDRNERFTSPYFSWNCIPGSDP